MVHGLPGVRRFEALFHNAAVPLCFVNKEASALHFNSQFEKVFGYSSEEVPTLDDWWRLAYPDPEYRKWVIDTCFEVLDRAAKTNSDIEPIEYRVTCKNGDVRTMVVYGSFVGDDLLLTFFDVTERKRADEALREAEVRYRTVADFTYDWENWENPDGTLRYVSPACERITGYPVERFMKEPDLLSRLILPEDQGVWAGHRHDVAESHGPHEVQFRIRRADGGIRWIEHACQPVTNQEGAFLGNRSSNRDITDRKQAEAKMLRADQRLRLHREQSPLGFLEWDEQFRAVEWNAACERIFGYTREEAIGQHAKDLILHEEVRDLVDSIFQSLMSRTGGQHSINRNVTKDGRIIICEWFNTTLVDTDGKAIGVASICKDITEQMLAEESVRKLSQAIQQSPVSIVITDLTGTIEFVNARFSQLTGYDFSEVVGQNPRILKSGETPDEEYRRLWETIGSGGVWHGEFHNRKKNGELFWEQATIAPIRDAEGAVSHYVAVKEDITQQKELEAQLRQTQRMEAVGQLAGGVAHDFNNMLEVIIGYAELALEKTTPENVAYNHLEQILKAGLRSAEVTKQLLAFARKQTIAPRVLDLNDTIAGMLELLRRLIGEGIDLTWRAGEGLWPVKMDPAQIHQVLANLCVNARDAMADVGRITIETDNVDVDDEYCAGHEGFRAGEYVVLSVGDTGHGMDMETASRVFEPFFSTKGVGKGTGLGLSTVFGIVKQNAGFISVYSEPGHGSTFKIYLPRHAEEMERIAEKAPLAPVPRGTETVLLVEDEPLVLDMVKPMLEDLGYTVLAASTPGEAVRLVQEDRGEIHLLLTDVVMPEKSGSDLEKQVRLLCPGIKCLFMSGYPGEAIAHLGVLDESVDFIEKPFSKQDLATKVREALDRKE